MRRERGFALVAALWVSVLLALAAGAVLQLGRSEVRHATLRTETVRLEAVADAALNLTLARLAGPMETQPPLDGTPVPATVDGVPVMLRVEDETGKVNLNLGDGRLLRLLLAGAGLETETAARMAGRILAWRDPQGDGRGGPFRSVGELRLVEGVGEALFRQLEPALTVWSDTDWIDPAFASAAVLAAIGAVPPPAGQARPRLLAVPGHAYTIRADIGQAFSRVAVVRLTGQAGRPFLVYRWD